MEKLTQQEQEIFNHKRKLLFNRLASINRSNMPIIHRFIEKGLIELIKSNHYEFLNGTYIDYIEAEVRMLVEYNETWVIRRKLYKKYFNFKDEDSFQKAMLIYSRYLLYCFHLSQESYYGRVKNDDNERVIQLIDDIKEAIGPYREGLDRYALANSYEKLMAFILSQDDLISNRDKYMEILKSLKDNFSYLYDHYMMNHENGCLVQNVNAEFFDAKQYVLDYHNKPYRKPIE